MSASFASAGTCSEPPATVAQCPAATTVSRPQQSSTDTGLAAGLGVPFGIAIAASVIYLVRKLIRKGHQGDSTHNENHQEVVRAQTPLVEANGYTEWEMATNRNTPEAPGLSVASSQT
ncbi:MAG: hypothetical protein Q9190_000564 [Brigantiaea leucoxantha]